MIRNILLIFILVNLFGCVDPDNVVVDNAEIYFDLTAFVERVKADHSELPIEKKVTLNEKSESKQFTSYNMKQELEMVSNYEINKPALKGKYTVEKSTSDGDSLFIYIAKDADLKTQRIEVLKNDQEVKEIKITGEQKTLLSKNKQSIIFAPEKSFHFTSEDDNRFGKKLNKEILITIN